MPGGGTGGVPIRRSQQPGAAADPIDAEQQVEGGPEDRREPDQANPADCGGHLAFGQQDMDGGADGQDQADRQGDIGPRVQQVLPDVIHGGVTLLLIRGLSLR
jgi:hypothetical protein